jgi:hypothetical protein
MDLIISVRWCYFGEHLLQQNHSLKLYQIITGMFPVHDSQ